MMAPQVHLPPKSIYRSSSSGILALIPLAWVPYVELIRLEKPTGIFNVYYPCLTGTSLAALLTKPSIKPMELLAVNLILFIGSILVRGAGCSWNDILDQDIDRNVSRTRSRPLARGALSTSSAYLFTGILITLFFSLHTQLPLSGLETESALCAFYSIPFVLATLLYPWTKRITSYPQVFLGIPSSWGIFMAFPALRLDIFSSTTVTTAACLLCLSNFAWTIISDTVYAFQDIADDIRLGVGSVAVRHEKDAKAILCVLGIVQFSCLLYLGLLVSAGPVYFIFVSVTLTTVATMIFSVNLRDPKECAWWFKYGCLWVGGLTASGFVGEFLWG